MGETPCKQTRRREPKLSNVIQFKAWPKTPRLFRDITITEKIDGTNACIIIQPDERTDYEIGDPSENPNAFPANHVIDPATGLGYRVAAQSRNRVITPGKTTDNYGFAGWVEANAVDLLAALGEGYHYGEWWGGGIARGYGLNSKYFSLFNTHRYQHLAAGARVYASLDNVQPVPVLYQGPNTEKAITDALHYLKWDGSKAAPGFAKPEGVIVYHSASSQVYKVLLENDEMPKGLVA